MRLSFILTFYMRKNVTYIIFRSLAHQFLAILSDSSIFFVGPVHPSASNVTPPNSSLIFYNRVPKCGSTSVYKAIKSLHKGNHFNVNGSRVYYDRWLNSEEQIEEIKNIQNVSMNKRFSPRLIYHRHVYFINYTQFGWEKP
ncbi:unnamed protein product, partial [Meganyctiphanes norvegica]